MNAEEPMTPAGWAAAGFEVALALGGLWTLWAAVLAPAARRRPLRLTRWEIGPADFAAFLGCVLVGATVPASLAVTLLRRVRLGDDATQILGGAIMHGGVLLGLFAFFRAFGGRSNPEGPPVSARAAARHGALTFLVAMPIVDLTSLAWDWFLTAAGLPHEPQDLVNLLENSQSLVLIGSLMAVATLLVPVTEELVFRAGLFRFARTRMPRWAAIALSSAVFGLLHQSWSSFLPLSVLSVVFCLAYERTGSIRTTMIAHALFNLNTFVIIAAGIGS